MKRLFNWLKEKNIIKEKDIINVGFLLFFFVFSIMILLFVIQLHSQTIELQKNNKQIESLLEANNSLVKKVVELKTKERKKIENIRDYILRYYRTVPPTVAMEIARNIIIASDKYNIPITPIVAVMEIESQFNPSAIGKKTKYGKARGLMQVMPKWWVKEFNLHSKYTLHDISIGIDSGVRVLKIYLCEKDNNMKKALYKYVNGDSTYVNDVYISMGKFVVFKGLANKAIIEEQPILQIDEEEEPKKKEVILEVDKKEETPKTFIHTVKYRGETLSLIAKWYTGDLLNWKKIHAVNPNIIETRMQIGDKITIPIEMMNSFILLTKEYVQTN